MEKIIGFDLGTGSIGTAVRNLLKGDTLKEQLEYFSSDVFDSGNGQSGEFSLAAERSKDRRARRLYDTRRRKLWATLHVLLEYNLCPISKESLHKWETYNKELGLKREYPIDDEAFNRWIKLDFDGDGTPDYLTPFHLRRELVSVQLDFCIDFNRYKLGRALYHIAQHRGFKSSKGETVKEQEKELEGAKSIKKSEEENDLSSIMKASESKKSKDLLQYMKEHACTTVGSALACLLDEGVRIRNSKYEAVRSQLIEEIKEIFKYQKGLIYEEELCNKLISIKKGEGCIFAKNGPRTNKSSIGKCTFEENKYRCSLYHPEYETYRAWQVLNNIKIRKDAKSPYEGLSIEIKKTLYNKLFTARVKRDFPFSEIRTYLEEKILGHKISNEQINYKDNQTIAGCPITARFIKLLGNDWKIWHQESKNTHKNNLSDERHYVSYSAQDIFNFCSQTDDLETITSFGRNTLLWDDEKVNMLVRLWSSIGVGYCMLSLKAIRNINRFLELGLNLSDSILLAKIPDLVSGVDIPELIHNYQEKIKKVVNETKDYYIIANNLIKEYISSSPEERFADHDTKYILKEDDTKNVINHCISYFGKATWDKMNEQQKKDMVSQICSLYQDFFSSSIRKTYEIPTLGKKLIEFLKVSYPNIEQKKWNKLYHPSQISSFRPLHSKGDRTEWRLGHPNIGSLKNPLVLRVLNILRNKVNYMLDQGIIDYKTRVVIETTREEHDTNELNDANMRWALETYKNKREQENKTIEAAIKEMCPNAPAISRDVIKKVRYDIEQNVITEDNYDCLTDSNMYRGKEGLKKYITSYKLWLEQNFQCMYTGKTINIGKLFDENYVDIEHTIPRSISFDGSDCNLTVCDAYYNRHIKMNKIPTQLANYDNDITINGITYTAIKPRLKKWEERVDVLKKRVEFWKVQSRHAQTKERKDNCIRQRHLWTFELNYWRKKLETFTITEYKDSFKNSQLVDTSIIAKYAIAFLKSVFTRVDAEKGAVTSEFRKIFGFQNAYEKKDRSLHSHHAIDATVLTLIPSAAKRDRMIQLFYKREELKDLKKVEEDVTVRNNLDIEIEGVTRKLNNEIADCSIGNNIASVIEYINSNILVNRRTKDQLLAPAKRNTIKKGKKVRLNDKSEKLPIYQKSNGDSIRTRLHEDTFYGAIKLPKETASKEFNRTFVRENGQFIYDEENPITMVCRVELSKVEKKSDFDKFVGKIIDPTVRNCIKNTVEKRLKSGMSFKAALENIYMVDKDGNEKRYDKNGKPLCPIRHVRCKASAGTGILKYTTAKELKKQIFISKKALVNIPDREYKSKFYVKNEQGSICLLYEKNEKDKIKRQIRILFPLDIAKLAKAGAKCDFEFFKKSSNYSYIDAESKEFSLAAILKVGMRVILWEKSLEDFKNIVGDKAKVNKLMFVVTKFNQPSTYYIYIRSHIKTSTAKDSEIHLTADKFNYLIEHRDFEIDELGNIILKTEKS